MHFDVCTRQHTQDKVIAKKNNPGMFLTFFIAGSFGSSSSSAGASSSSTGSSSTGSGSSVGHSNLSTTWKAKKRVPGELEWPNLCKNTWCAGSMIVPAWSYPLVANRGKLDYKRGLRPSWFESLAAAAARFGAMKVLRIPRCRILRQKLINAQSEC